ncbi:hypothetical protein GEMRC1_010124 [Eukaryota sp. GEM-RC1]
MINLSRNDIGFKTLLTVFEHLSTNKSPPNIKVSPHYIDSEYAIFSFSPQVRTKITAKNMSVLLSLEIIDLRINKCTFTDEALAVLCELLKTSTKLTSLDLCYCRLSDVNFLSIIDSLRLNSALNVRGIYFEGNLFGNCSAKALAELLKENATISKIDLWGNSVGNEGALAFSNVLKLNYTIKSISLENNPINQGTKSEIKKYPIEGL